MEFPPTPEATRTGGEVPRVTASQASALLRSAMAISTELMGAAFPDITKTLLDELSGKWDFDVGSPLVQRHLAAKSDALFHEFMARLQETQDQYLNDLTVGRSQGPAPALDSETLSLVDSISVESTTIVDRHASKIAGHADHPLRDLNLVVAFLLGRGDLLETGGTAQRTWEHADPKVGRAGPRNSIAFRYGLRGPTYLAQRDVGPPG